MGDADSSPVLCQVPPTRNSNSPTSSSFTEPFQRSFSSFSSTERRQEPPSRRSSNQQSYFSCPNNQMSASTSKRSPTSRLAGQRPPSTEGLTFSNTKIEVSGGTGSVGPTARSGWGATSGAFARCALVGADLGAGVGVWVFLVGMVGSG